MIKLFFKITWLKFTNTLIHKEIPTALYLSYLNRIGISKEGLLLFSGNIISYKEAYHIFDLSNYSGVYVDFIFESTYITVLFPHFLIERKLPITAKSLRLILELASGDYNTFAHAVIRELKIDEKGLYQMYNRMIIK